MNPFQKRRLQSGWLRSHLAHWVEGDTAYLSVVFSWNLSTAVCLARRYLEQGYKVRAGGPAVMMNPDPLIGLAAIGGRVNALAHHNSRATVTSRGCIRRCSFCGVPKLEGGLVELREWEPKPLVCDNNLLACSRVHFDRVIDRLGGIKDVDFNQGLDARLLTKHHADRIAELDLRRVRLAWDNTKTEPEFMWAWELLRGARIAKRKIAVYALIGYKDTPADARYRLERIRALGCYTSPMRYQPVDSPKRNSYVAPSWTQWELIAYMRYWSNNRLSSIPFDEWLDWQREKR